MPAAEVEEDVQKMKASAMTGEPAPQKEEEPLTCSDRWTNTINSFMKPILNALLKLTRHAALHPMSYTVSIIVISIALMAIGLATNFNVAADEDQWTATGTLSVKHGKWIEDESGFPAEPRYMHLIIHRGGLNVVGDDLAKDGVERVFQMVDVVRNTPGYAALCANRDYYHPVTGEKTCDIISVTNFWNDDTELLRNTTVSNADAIDAMSKKTFPSGIWVDFDQIIGKNQCNDGASLVNCTESGTLSYGESYVTVIGLPGEEEDEDEALDFEKDVIDNLMDLQDAWKEEDGNDFRLEIDVYRSFGDEFMRAISADFPLLPVVFILMSILCVAVFSKRDPVLSRGWLGFGAVITVLLALIASFGLLFIIGVPFTNLTPILPFIMFGVGLDDAFIILGAYTRTDHLKETASRIEETIADVGGTILLTTVTATVAFALGVFSSIPAVRYLVMYAFPTILIDFFYQVTFFVGLIVLDERRIKDNRRDCCLCCRDETPGSHSFRIEQETTPKSHFADRAMAKYSTFLLKPMTKVVVLFSFAFMFAGLAYSTSKLEQYFDFTSILPSDSYIRGWWDALNDYTDKNGVFANIYFRDVDFSLNATRQAMYDYVQELVDMKYAGTYPTYDFWLVTFDRYVADKNITILPFEEQLDQFLSEDIHEKHKEHIVLDGEGNMLASRTVLVYTELDSEDIKETIDALEEQERISRDQPINQGLKDWAFFTFSESYYIWEFYKASPQELILTTIIGTVSVSFLAMLFIPHWSAAFIVFFMLAILYIDLLGFIQVCGVSVGPVMYISMVMSIGLLVDYVMHVTYRYMEVEGKSREEKVKKTLETIGASVMVGGVSTLIGVLPLGFSSSEIFFTVFIVFFGLVLLGLLHGLVLLPVLLSIGGPLVVLSDAKVHEHEQTHIEDVNEDPLR